MRHGLRLASLLLVAAAPLGAQSLGTLRGVVYDSLVGAPLAGAEVWLEGSARNAISARDGTFRIDSLAAGTYTITFGHASLDSLGIGAPFGRVGVKAGDTTYALLATPSMLGLAHRLCPADTAAGHGTLVGVVRDAAGGAPLANAQIEVRWSEFDVSHRTSSAHEETRTGVSGPGGRYVVCGLPTDIGVGVQARMTETDGAARRTGLALVDVRDRVLTWHDVTFGVAAATGSAGTATLLLTMVDRDGHPVSGAQARVGDRPEFRTASDDGRLRVAGLPSGDTELEVRALGYEPITARLRLDAGRERAETMRLARGAVPLLETVRVTGTAHVAPEMAGFEIRKRQGFGYFMERNEIERHQATRLTQLLRGVPGLRFERTSPTDVTVSSARTSLGALGGSCPLGLIIDGQVIRVDVTETPANDVGLTGPSARGVGTGAIGKATGPASAPADMQHMRRQTIDDFVSPQSIAAIEVYPSMTGTPTQYGRFPCGAVVVWTRAVAR